MALPDPPAVEINVKEVTEATTRSLQHFLEEPKNEDYQDELIRRLGPFLELFKITGDHRYDETTIVDTLFKIFYTIVLQRPEVLNRYRTDALLDTLKNVTKIIASRKDPLAETLIDIFKTDPQISLSKNISAFLSANTVEAFELAKYFHQINKNGDFKNFAAYEGRMLASNRKRIIELFLKKVDRS